MRYNLDSTLPINAFSPRGKSPFSYGMTLEGGGSVNPVRAVTDLGSSVANIGTKAVNAVVQPIYNATLKQIPGIDNALVNLDKSVAKSIPGGWGTVAAVASSFIPGAQLAALGMTQTGLATGLGALSGSGVMHKGNQFNLQGAIMGGAMAYGASQLAQGFQEMGKATTDVGTKAVTDTGTSALTGTSSAPVSGASTLTPTANALQNIPENFVPPSSYTPPVGSPSSFAPSGDYGIKNLASNPIVPSGDFGINPAISSTANGLGTSAPTSMLDKVASSITNIPGAIADKATAAYDTLISPDTYSNMGTKIADTASGTLSNVSDAGAGIKNLVTGASSLPANITMTNTALPLIMGTSGVMALQEQQKQLDAQLAAGNIAQDQYNAESAKIAEETAIAQKAVNENPLHASADLTNVANAPVTYGKSTDTTYDKSLDTLYAKHGYGNESVYAAGGSVNPPDDQTGMMNKSPMTNFGQPGIMSMVDRTVPQQTFAAGGMPRFLSGGGDGMSDSIEANINGSQEARLADGEFVVPADVVSHLGNGSSKAGAKQLYSMMDKVRQARTGTKKQGKQINPRKYLAA
jgi:hypothetical protein